MMEPNSRRQGIKSLDFLGKADGKEFKLFAVVLKVHGSNTASDEMMP